MAVNICSPRSGECDGEKKYYFLAQNPLNSPYTTETNFIFEEKQKILQYLSKIRVRAIIIEHQIRYKSIETARVCVCFFLRILFQTIFVVFYVILFIFI